MIKRYRCYYLNDFRDDYDAFSTEDTDGEWVKYEDHIADNQRLAQERDAYKRDAEELRKIAERMLGMHNAPQDCYSTGPFHGDIRDESCPSCELVRYLAARSSEAGLNEDAKK